MIWSSLCTCNHCMNLLLLFPLGLDSEFINLLAGEIQEGCPHGRGGWQWRQSCPTVSLCVVNLYWRQNVPAALPPATDVDLPVQCCTSSFVSFSRHRSDGHPFVILNVVCFTRRHAIIIIVTTNDVNLAINTCRHCILSPVANVGVACNDINQNHNMVM